MLRVLCLTSLTAVMLVGCAHQAPADQVSRAATVRICQGQQCHTQDAQHVTRQDTPVDTEAQRRLAALEKIAQNHPQAAYDLGLRLLRGDGVERDSYQALQWMRQAADQGLVQAQFALGQMYLVGLEEMGPDPSEAHAWLARAAAQGHAQAQQLLPEAQAAKQEAHTQYQVRESLREAWGAWQHAAPYYWQWGAQGWHLY